MLAVRPIGKNARTISLTYNLHHGVLCVVRVYALYSRSRRILGLLLFLSMGSLATSSVSRSPLTLRLVQECLNFNYCQSRCHYY